MLNLNYNINSALQREGCRGVMKYDYSASILVVGGGGGGATGAPVIGVGGKRRSGGGGGGAAFYQTNINIVPNVTYSISVGAGGLGGTNVTASNGENGQSSSFVGFDDDIQYPLSIITTGGDGGQCGNFVIGGVGGNSGTLTINSLLISSSKIGGGGGASEGGAGGGASFTQNGFSGSGNTGGNGGVGTSGSLIANFDWTIGGGGGGGAATPSDTGGYPNPNQDPGISGGFGGGALPTGFQYGSNAQSNGGGGGGGASANLGGGYGAGGNGSKGVVIIKYAGEPKAIVTNATTITSGGFTTHTFETGSGTFTYPIPYPWPDVVPYQVEVCPEARLGFFPYLKPDPYSASLVAAVPGQIFYNPNDRSPLFGAGTNPYYDVSSQIKGTGTSLTLTAEGNQSASITTFPSSPWGTNYGYNSALYMPVEAALNAGTGSQLTITTSSNWVVEAWVAFPTASNEYFPNHFLLNKVDTFGNTSTNNSYAVSIVTTTKVANINDGNFPTPTGAYPISGGLCVQLFEGITPNYGYVTLWPPQAVTQSFVQNGWNHFAVSMQVENFGGVNYAVYRGFVNGNKILEQYTGAYGGGAPAPIRQANPAVNTPVLLMGNLFEEVQLQLNPIGNPDTWVTQSAAIFQDFRFYNGTNKNYTASFNVNQVVQPIVIGSAY